MFYIHIVQFSSGEFQSHGEVGYAVVFLFAYVFKKSTQILRMIRAKIIIPASLEKAYMFIFVFSFPLYTPSFLSFLCSVDRL